MVLINGWIIADKSLYTNYTRFRKDSVDSYIFYTSDVKDDEGNEVKNQHHIIVFTKGTEHKIFYKDKPSLIEAFDALDEIMWRYEDEEPPQAYVKD